MPTTIQYALLAGASYHDTRADLNRFPIPNGWSIVSLVPQDPSTGGEKRGEKRGHSTCLSGLRQCA